MLPLDVRFSDDIKVLIKLSRKLCCLMFSIVLSDVSGQKEGSLAISTAQREKRLLNGLIQNLLPAVGPSVKSIILAYSSTVSSKMVCSAKTFIMLHYN